VRNICRALEQEWLSPEERRRKAEADERRRDQEERRRQKTEDRFYRLDDEAEKRLRDEEGRRLEKESRRTAKEEQHRTQLEPEPQRPVKPWVLPLIGAGAAALTMLLFTAAIVFSNDVPPRHIRYIFFAAVMIDALYGGAAGMLTRRFGIPKAVAIPIIPALLLLLIVAQFDQTIWWSVFGLLAMFFAARPE